MSRGSTLERNLPANVLETVPPAVVTAIYAYLVGVFALGLYLNGRIWFGYRRSETG